MVTDNVPGPARVVLMKNSDWMPGREEMEYAHGCSSRDKRVWPGGLSLGS